jgi:hypothetical protein
MKKITQKRANEAFLFKMPTHKSNNPLFIAYFNHNIIF